MNEASGPKFADVVIGESAVADPKISAKEELEVIDLSSDPDVHRPVSIVYHYQLKKECIW